MGKKYIVEIGRLERLYKAFIGAHGKPEITWLSPEVDLTPYTEPDLDAIRKEAYDKGLSDSKNQDAKDFVDMYDSGYSEGLKDAWEAVDKIFDMPCKLREQLFNRCDSVGVWDVIREYSASEAIEKIRQYEQEKEKQIHVGDEVTTASGKAVVTGVGPVHFEYDYADGSHGYDEVKNVKKTGRHFPEIAEVLRKMKESDNG